MILIHAISWPFGEGVGAMPPAIDALRAALERDAQVQLRRIADAARAAGLVVEESVGAGKPSAHILRRARRASADLIVMGLHGRAARSLALLGSTTRHVLHDAPCPILAVRDRPARRRTTTRAR